MCVVDWQTDEKVFRMIIILISQSLFISYLALATALFDPRFLLSFNVNSKHSITFFVLYRSWLIEVIFVIHIL